MPRNLSEATTSKLPQITAAFWVMKIAATTLGETAGDLLSMTLNVGYALSSVILLSMFLASLGAQLSTRRYRPLLYWTVILTTNTLGTALGDFLADSSGLGFAGGALLIGSLLAVVLLLTYFTSISRVLLFWVAFVLTRPFGATLGDVLTKPHDQGGLELGTIGSSAVLGSVLLILIGVAMLEQRRKRPALAPAQRYSASTL